MNADTLRIYYSNRLEGTRYACDVELNRSQAWPIQIGSDEKCQLVLASDLVPRLAAALTRSDGRWWLEPYSGGCALDDAEVRPGRKYPIDPGVEVRIGPYSLAIEMIGKRSVDEAGNIVARDLEASELIARAHAELLPRLPRDIDHAGGPSRGQDESLLDVEHIIEEAGGRMIRTNDASMLNHMAGLCVRSELLRTMIERSARTGEMPGRDTPGWSRMVSVVPELERDLARLLRTIDQMLGASSLPVRDRVTRVEQVFWSLWDNRVIHLIDQGARTYLALRHLKKELKDLLFGLGPLEDLLRTPTISEIMVNDANHIYIEHDHVLKNSGRRFVSNEVTQSIIERIVARVGRRIDKSQPMVDARLADGSRVNAVIPPLAVNGPCLTIRRFPDRSITMERLIEWGSLTRPASRLLEAAVRSRKNILVAGGTGSGKTTMLNCLSDAIPDHERIVTIEDTAELQLQHEHVVRLETKDRNLEQQGAVSIRDLVRNALRMRPDRIVVGECRGPEALDMLQAMNTGHDGSLTTIHANSPEDVVSRLEVMVLAAAPLPLFAVHRQIASAIDLVVHLEHRESSRRVSHISELAGFDARAQRIRFRTIFEPDHSTGRLVPTGCLPSFTDVMIARGGLTIDTFYS